ncbi:hypothetical protein, partial [Pseudomonas amygdali]|uniref:hypothetical protein n=1 Tax=Pseudomonas amygdali TaxID=47877 RepID=UPI001E4E57AF
DSISAMITYFKIPQFAAAGCPVQAFGVCSGQKGTRMASESQQAWPSQDPWRSPGGHAQIDGQALIA